MSYSESGKNFEPGRPERAASSGPGLANHVRNAIQRIFSRFGSSAAPSRTEAQQLEDALIREKFRHARIQAQGSYDQELLERFRSEPHPFLTPEQRLARWQELTRLRDTDPKGYATLKASIQNEEDELIHQKLAAALEQVNRDTEARRRQRSQKTREELDQLLEANNSSPNK